MKCSRAHSVDLPQVEAGVAILSIFLHEAQREREKERERRGEKGRNSARFHALFQTPPGNARVLVRIACHIFPTDWRFLRTQRVSSCGSFRTAVAEAESSISIINLRREHDTQRNEKTNELSIGSLSGSLSLSISIGST